MSEQTPSTPADGTPLATPVVPAGWYPTPDGSRRYWDGATWVALPDPSDVEETTPTLPSHKRRRRPLLAIVAALAVVLIAGGIFWKTSTDAQAASAKASQAAAAKHAAAAKEEAAKEAADEAAAAQKAKDDAERASRAVTVTEIEGSIKDMATKDVSVGVLKGPILSVSCSPVSGGSTDDLTQLTTVFQCFAANVTNADGSQSGYYFHATMNWSAGNYTYGLGDAS